MAGAAERRAVQKKARVTAASAMVLKILLRSLNFREEWLSILPFQVQSEKVSTASATLLFGAQPG